MTKTKTINGRKYSLQDQLPTGSHSRRLASLETHMQPAVSASPQRTTDDEWVDMFRVYAGQGAFNDEPDFAQAFAEYQEAIRKTADDPTQHYHPPAGFMPNATRLQRERLWRDSRNFEAIDIAWLWLAAIFSRVLHDEPGMSLAEWEQLKDWFLRESPSWQEEDVDEHLDGMSLAAFQREVKENNGKTTKTAKWIGILRKLWASQYGRSAAINSV